MSISRTETFTSSLSWNTRISRTRTSTTDALSLSGAPVLTAKGLDHLLRTIQQLGLQCYSFDELQHEAVIGEGESFRVEKCLYNKQIVAVKHVKLGLNDYRRLQSVLLEIQIMRHGPLQNHPNILSALGYGWKADGERLLPYVVVDYAEHGSLRAWLRRDEVQVPATTKFKLAGDIALGLKALHVCDIIHGDLKLDNILVVPTLGRKIGVVAKLCDFGHSIILRTGTRDFKYYGTILYNAPEVEDQEITRIEPENLHKCDIWAYGLAVWEIFANGARYFKPSWASDIAYKSQTPVNPPAYGAQTVSDDIALSSLSGSFVIVPQDTTTKEPSHDPAAVRKGPNADGKGESPLGSFSYKHLQPLSRQFVNNLHFPGMTIEKGYLRKLLSNTLQIDPSLRPWQIILVPTMMNWDRSDQTILQEELSLHTGSTALNFDIFRFEQESEMPWEDKRRIVENLESISNNYSTQDQARTAASTSLQASFSYLTGFGVWPNQKLASHFLEMSMGLEHPMALMFGYDLLQAIDGESAEQPGDYTSKIIQGFLAEGLQVKGVELHDKDGALLVGPEKFKDYAALKSFIKALNEEQVRKTLATYAITYPYSVRMDLLSLAIAMDDVATVKRLAKLFIGYKRSVSRDDTPLIQACKRSNREMVLALLDAGADPNEITDDGCTLYHWLFMLGNDISYVLNLLSLSIHTSTSWTDTPKLLDHPCSRSYVLHPQWPLKLQGTPLAFAIESNSVTAVRALLDLGASPIAPVQPHDTSTNISWTPLHLAFKYHQSDIAMMLTWAINPLLQNCKQIPGIDAIELARGLCFSTTVERISMHKDSTIALKRSLELLDPQVLSQASKDGQTPFMQAIDFSNLDVVQQMLLVDPELPSVRFVDPSDWNIFTYPEIFAAQIAARRPSSDALQILEILLSHGRNFIPKDSQGRTALHLSVTGCSTLATETLLRKGLDVDALDNDGRAAIHMCTTSASLSILLDNGAQINRMDKLGFTPLHAAALQGIEDLVEKLIFGGANLQACTAKGTALHCAVLKQSWRIASVLLKADDGKGNKLDINAVDNNGDTALHVAARLSRPDLLQLLFSHKIDTSIRNHKGLTAKSQLQEPGLGNVEDDSRRKSELSHLSIESEVEKEAEEKDSDETTKEDNITDDVKHKSGSADTRKPRLSTASMESEVVEASPEAVNANSQHSTTLASYDKSSASGIENASTDEHATPPSSDPDTTTSTESPAHSPSPPPLPPYTHSPSSNEPWAYASCPELAASLLALYQKAETAHEEALWKKATQSQEGWLGFEGGAAATMPPDPVRREVRMWRERNIHGMMSRYP